MGCFQFVVLLGLIALVAGDAETCGTNQEIKLFRTELGSGSDKKRIHYLNDVGGQDDETYILISTNDGVLMNSTNGGISFVSENAEMPGASESGVPYYRLGVNQIYHSHDGAHVWATSFKLGYWHKPRFGDWDWHSTDTDYVLSLFPHPTDANRVMGIFRSQGCYNSSAVDSCKSYLRISMDAGHSWNTVNKQVIQTAWSTKDENTVIFSSHDDQDGDYHSMGWYDSTLHKGTLNTQGVFQTVLSILPHQSGMAYVNGIVVAAQRIDANSNQVYLYSSVDDARTGMKKAIFRNFFDNEVSATSFTLLDMTEGSIFINLRSDQYDRGDLYQSAAFSHDFELILPDNVRGGSTGDFSKLASLRGVYVANVFVPPDNEIATGITYNMGANWDFVNVPESLKSKCNSSSEYDWCGMHFLGRSNFNVGEAPYSAPGAIGLAMATGNVGKTLDTDAPDEMATFLTRDGGVSWKQVASGDNLYAMADRGAVLVFVEAREETTSKLYWSWNEGKDSSACEFGVLGDQLIHALTTSPSHDGLRFHLLSESDGKHYVITADFSNLADSKCIGEDTPDTIKSNYETWVPTDPDGGQKGCLLGSKTTYVRRKQNVKCFNADNDLVHDSKNCQCERDDFECDDCYELSQFWVKGSACVKKAGPCYPNNPCANGESQYNETKGYRRVPFDTCIAATGGDDWTPVVKQCKNGDTQGSGTTSLNPPATTSPVVVDTTAPVGITTTQGDGTNPPQATTTPQGTEAPSHTGAIAAAVIIILLIVGLVVGFMVARKNPKFRQRFGGKLPFVTAPEDPYSTLGELDTGNSGFDEDF